jgi:hypothetical protein
MKRITGHHDGHGRMERLLVLATDEPATEPPGNTSHHEYHFFAATSAEGAAEATKVFERGGVNPVAAEQLCYLQFQRGPFDAPGSTPGTLGAAVIAALIDHYQGFQAGPLASRETALAITKLQEALFWLRERADERARRAVLGTMEK